jgi:UDP-glucose:(heptosyl)LPS alpha-1,3-glucosyltransferase
MHFAFGIVNLFSGGGLQRDCVGIAHLLRDRGHDVTIYAERVAPGFDTGGVDLVTLPNRARSNHARQHGFAVDFLREATARNGVIVGFDKLLGLDVLYCADPSTGSRLAREPYLRLLPRYRTYADIEGDAFAPHSQTRTILLSETQLHSYRNAWHTPPQRMYLLPPTLCSGRRRPELRSNGARPVVRQALGLADGDWVWLTTGSQPKTKGTDRAIDALARFPDAKLLIAGMRDTDAAARRVVAQARRLGVASRIIWLGHREDMAEVMAAADLLLHPSRYDTTGTVILEAVVNGLPVIATAACGYASHIGAARAGIVIPEPFARGAFQAAIASARNSAARAAWSAAGAAYGARGGLSDGRLRAAQVMLAVAQDRYPALAETADVGLVPALDEAQFDVSTLQPLWVDEATPLAQGGPSPDSPASPR